VRSAVLTVAVLSATASVAADYTVLDGHGGPVMSTAVSGDGALALTASFDNSVGLWDLVTGDVTWLEAHEAAVKTAIFLPDSRAASAGDDFAIEIWDLKSGSELTRLTGHKGQIKALAVSPQADLLASASWDGTIGLWALSTGEKRQFLTGHNGAVNDVAFAENGTRLYSASADGTIRLWTIGESGTGDIIVRHGFGATELVIDESAGWLAYGAVDGGTRVLSLDGLDELADLTLDRRPILAMAASPDGTQIAVGDGEGYIMVVDTATWQIEHDFNASPNGPVWALAYTADGSGILAAGIDDAAYIWPIGEGDAPLFSEDTRDFLRAPSTMTNGERQFQRKCAICHSLTASNQRRAGPSLRGLFGRRAGTVPDYSYSQTLDGSDIVWNEETIDQLFDLGPEHYIPGTKMPMQRITAPQDRRDLIAFLKSNT
jgi:cytochrome c